MDTLLTGIGLIFIVALLLLVKHPASRNSNQWKIIRLAVLKRDKFTCQKCGRKGGYLEVHHIKSWNAYPELRFVMSNLITYCRSCHEQTDSYKYWKSKQ
jgi:5-methylcytosine-specific restriction endonuclease McrA